MQDNQLFDVQTQAPAIEINKVLRNTYLLLAMTLLVSTIAAAISIAVGTNFFLLSLTLIDVEHLNCPSLFIRNVSAAIAEEWKDFVAVILLSTFLRRNQYIL